MIVIKLTQTPDDAIKAETSTRLIGYFEDMDEAEVARYLVAQAEAVGEKVEFVDEFEPQPERVNYQRLMKRHF